MIESLFRVAILASLIALLGYFIKKTPNVFLGLIKTTRERLYLSIPLGTIVIIFLNISIYLFVQRGFWHLENPLWLPFASSGVSNPIGIILSSLTHMNPSHLVSNVFAMLFFAPIAEIIFNTNKRKFRVL